MVRYAIGLPNVREFGDPRMLVDMSSEAEQAGWDGVFLWDHLLWQEPDEPVADPVVVASAVAAATERVTFGILVTLLARRRPAKVARELLTLDHLSGGRVVFGAGLGSLAAEWSAFGEDPDPAVRAEKVDEGLDVIRALWSGEPVTHGGRHFQVDGAVLQPPPVRPEGIPVWIGGSWPHRRPFRRAARFDGVMPTHTDYGLGTTMPPEELRAVVEYVRRHRPGGEPFDVALEGATDGQRPREGAAHVEAYVDAGLTWWIEALGWWRGSVADMRRRVTQGPPTVDHSA